MPDPVLLSHRAKLRLSLVSTLFGGLLLTPQSRAADAAGTNDVTKLPPVTVTAQKEAQPLQSAPVSVTPVTRSILEDSGARYVNDAAMFAPNVFMTEFSARKLSNPRFRGVGSSPNNPGVTTYLDGVPQLNANSSSLELIDVDQIEFVRGPQGALFGRNTVGGLINITSARPSLDRWTGGATGGFGNYSFTDTRLSVSGPVVDQKLSFGFAGGYSSREGFARNTVTGNDLDSREAYFGKAQLLWHPATDWEARLILSGERARDGDYRLNDLAAVRARPFTMARNVEGYTHRELLAPTLVVSRTAGPVDFTMTTAGVWWKTVDATDLDYTAAPLIERLNAERNFQFTQEFRFASPKDAPIQLSDAVDLKWQAGTLLFTQDYEQDANNFFPNPAFIGFPGGTPAHRSFTQSELQDLGVGVFGQTTLTLWDKLDLALGVRGDWENKDATLRAFTVPAGLGATTTQNLGNSYLEVTPQFGASYRLTPAHSVYASVTRGYKAGGFNAGSPAGTQEFGKEYSWNYEAGLKTTWLEDRLRANFAAFYTHWESLQLNVPNPLAPNSFYVSNVGSAASKGVEVELSARPAPGWDMFAGAGYNSAQFLTGSTSGGVNVGGRNLPFTPDFTLNGGAQYSFAIAKDTTAYARGETVTYGRYFYNDANGAAQSTYTLANFRVGVRGKHWSVEGWMRNALDTDYVPMAFAFAGLAPSGFLGEAGAPMTMGLTLGLRF